MTNPNYFSLLMDAMQEQISLFTAYIDLQKKFTKYLKGRDWDHLQVTMSNMQLICGKITAIEESRSIAEVQIREMYICADEDFYTLLRFFPERIRKEAVGLYRDLQRCVRRARLETKMASEYALAKQNFLHAALDTLFPDHRAKVYNKQGARTQSQPAAILVNTSL